MSDFSATLEWLRKIGVDVKGVLHIGANTGQEAGDYAVASCKVIWIEGDPELFERLKTTVSSFPNQEAYCCLCSDVEGKALTLHVASNDGGSSSVLPPNDSVFAAFGAGLKMVATRTLVARRLDAFFAENNVRLDAVNVINVDVQGFELPALRGLGDRLGLFDAIVAELNWAAAYQGATRPHALESHLAGHGFRRVWLSVGYPQGVGIWVRKPTSATRRTQLFVSIRFIEMLSALGVFRALQGTRFRGVLRNLYYRVKGRAPAS